jgi:hypothetical protein
LNPSARFYSAQTVARFSVMRAPRRARHGNSLISLERVKGIEPSS